MSNFRGVYPQKDWCCSDKIKKELTKVEWMKNIEQKIAYFDWQTVTGDINQKVYALVSRFLPAQKQVTITEIF